ncbi:B12-binding domain-containing protein [Chenggangzhangella methanolivorans]|uniref:cobalamin B12-binding domain-containing protein n=1 Tax=Chenggangzhangella methanolivorans TaxID=1437009 RepID=UPI00360DC616
MVILDEAGTSSTCEQAVGTERELRAFARGAPIQRSATLARVIEADIIPRLLLARGPVGRASAPASLEVDAEDIAGFAAMMVALDLRKAELVVARALESGVAIETVLLDLLAPTAQRLGQMWVDDELTFTDVTVGLCTLQNLLRSVTSGEAADPRALFDGRILLSATPGEQHTFGVLMLETMFRRAGWDTVGLPLTDTDEICAMVGRRDFSVVGFSLSRESALEDLAGLIAQVRRASRNSSVVVMVGGRVFNDEPSLVRRVGADITAQDGKGALVASHSAVCSRMQTH